MKLRFSKMAGPALFLFVMLALVFAVDRPKSGSEAASGTLMATSSMGTARAGHTATLLPSGKVLITGGFAGSGYEGSPYSSAELYDPAGGKFVFAGSMTARRSGHTATLLRSGKVLLIGGWTGGDVLRTAELYDPATRAFAVTGSMAVARAEFTATLLPDGKVLVAGGVDRTESALASAELYDPSTGSFALTGSMTTARAAHTATLLKYGNVLITGGSAGHFPSQTVFQSAELYDPATGKFISSGNMTTNRHKHAAILLPNGKVLVIGGSNNRDWRGMYSSVELYDPVNGTFSASGSMRTARFKLPSAVALLIKGKVLIAGGAERVEIYDPDAGTFGTAAGSLDTSRFYSAATLLPNGKALITGGYGPDAPRGGLASTASAWIYEP